MPSDEPAGRGTLQDLLLTLNALERKGLMLQREAALARTLLLGGHLSGLRGGSGGASSGRLGTTAMATTAATTTTADVAGGAASSLASATVTVGDDAKKVDSASSCAIAPSSPMEEVRLLKLVYGDACAAVGLDPNDQLAGFSHALRLLARAPQDPEQLWLSVVLKFPEAYPAESVEARVVDSSGLTTGDLAMLELVLQSKVRRSSLIGCVCFLPHD